MCPYGCMAVVLKMIIKMIKKINEKVSQILLENNFQLCYIIFRLKENRKIDPLKLTLLNIIHSALKKSLCS